MDQYLDFKKINDREIEVTKKVVKETTQVIRFDLAELEKRREALVEAQRVTRVDWEKKDAGFQQQIDAIDGLVQVSKDNGVISEKDLPNRPDPKTVERG